MKKIIIAVCLFAHGCATIISGTKQQVDIISYPERANIIIDGKQISQTPAFVILKRKTDQYRLKIEKAGYIPYEIILKQSFNYWTLGNLIILGVWLFPIDGATGAMWKFQDKISVSLVKENDR